MSSSVVFHSAMQCNKTAVCMCSVCGTEEYASPLNLSGRLTVECMKNQFHDRSTSNSLGQESLLKIFMFSHYKYLNEPGTITGRYNKNGCQIFFDFRMTSQNHKTEQNIFRSLLYGNSKAKKCTFCSRCHRIYAAQ